MSDAYEFKINRILRHTLCIAYGIIVPSRTTVVGNRVLKVLAGGTEGPIPSFMAFEYGHPICITYQLCSFTLTKKMALFLMQFNGKNEL